MCTEGNCRQTPAPSTIQETVVFVRLELYNKGVACGPKAIREAMDTQYHIRPLPAERTIARILAQHGLTRGRTGWYQEDPPPVASLPVSIL